MMTGMILGNRYKLIEQIGSGGMAIVYKAQCLLLNRFVAVKVLRPELKGDQEFVQRFKNESQAAAKLSHPNVVSVYDVGTENDLDYIVMEYVEGITLKQYIERHGAMNWEEAVDCGTQICSALDAAHKGGIVHKDIKPHNVMITPEGIVKVTDFGIARAINSNTIALGNSDLGSVHYLSPEQAKGSMVDARSDLYSLGIVLYEMLTGKPPFDGDTAVSVAMKQISDEPIPPKSINPKIPQVVENIVLKSLQKDKNNRYQTASEMMIDLKRAYINPNENFLASPQPISSEPKVEEQTMRIPVIPHGKQPTGRSPYTGAAQQGGDVAMATKKTKTGGRKGPMSKEDKIAVIAAVITAFLIIGVASFFLFNMLYPASGELEDGKYKVPALSNMTVKDAEKLINNKQVTIKVEKEEYSKDVKENCIITHTPAAGEIDQLPLEIKVVISKGIQSIRLEDYTGRKYSDVEDDLEDLNLMYRIVYETSSKAEGTVLRQEPSSGTTVKTGDTIVLYVSGEKAPKTVSVPDLIGMTESQAKKSIENADLSVGSIKYEETTASVGKVMKQSMKPNIQVAEKTSIDLIIGKEKSEETTQAPSQAPTQQPTAPPVVNVTKPVYINLPQDNESVQVKVTANGTVIHNATHNSSEGTVVVNVTGSGNVTVQIYFDGILKSTQSVNLS